jgi:hypothetical protein
LRGDSDSVADGNWVLSSGMAALGNSCGMTLAFADAVAALKIKT